MWRLDHLAVVCADLAAGSAWVETALGAKLVAGGKHARYGTHNRLLGLGPDLYLEVIAPDPEAAPQGPRWFGLDAVSGAPRLGNWIVACDNLDAALASSPNGVGEAVDLERGDLRWRIAVPGDGSLPMGGGWPTLIEWAPETRHPALRLADSGLRLKRLTIRHPQARDIASQLAPLLAYPRIAFEPAPTPSLSAIFLTPKGQERLLC
ncbi:MAG: VOC family protein [Marivivens sp.]